MQDIEEEIVNYLSKRKFTTIATSTKNGKPLTHTVAYVNIGPNLYFSTSNQTRKIKNIQENPKVAYSVYDETEHLDEIRSIQMEGESTIISDEKESEEAIKMLCQKFPHMAEMAYYEDNIIVKIVPKLCYFSDYTKRFGRKEIVEF